MPAAIAPPPHPALRGLGLPAERVARWAALGGWPVWPAGGAALALAETFDDAALAACLAAPHRGGIETAGLDDAAVVAAVRRAEPCAVFLSLGTARAARLPVAPLVAAAAAARGVPAERGHDVELALHEALSNAVLHGNLQVDGLSTLSLDALGRFGDAVDSRMADARYGGRRVEVLVRLEPGTLVLEVADQGPGFAPAARAAAGPSGRGLELIAAMTDGYVLLDGGRRIRMRVAL
ncbi:MAG TPA: ATP-binding protein [Alphaproteobacteria bacterium]|nr:ATP-binding protein [Alphaproteobacteria bacterium]